MLFNVGTMLTRLRVEANTENIARDLKRIEAIPKDLRTYFKRVAIPRLEMHIHEIFRSRGLGQWPPSQREQRGVGKTLIRTGRLYSSYTQSGSRDNRTIIRKKNFEYSSLVPYARFHEVVTRGAGPRPVIGLVIKRGLIQRSFARSLNLYFREKAGLR